MFELYEQLLPNRLYASQKIHTRRGAGCVVRPQKVWLTILCGCGGLTQNKYIYLSRHDSALKILFYEMLHDLGLIDEVPPW